MLSGSDEHGTPITVTADETGKSPQAVVDENHDAIFASLVELGCSWGQKLDRRGVEYGGALYGRTSDPRHHELVPGRVVGEQVVIGRHQIGLGQLDR